MPECEHTSANLVDVENIPVTVSIEDDDARARTQSTDPAAGRGRTVGRCRELDVEGTGRERSRQRRLRRSGWYVEQTDRVRAIERSGRGVVGVAECAVRHYCGQRAGKRSESRPGIRSRASHD